MKNSIRVIKQLFLYSMAFFISFVTNSCDENNNSTTESFDKTGTYIEKADLNELINKIVGLKYEYVEEYNAIIPERRYFRKSCENNFHIHLVQYGGLFWDRHILFRDFLTKNEIIKNEYASLKRQLAEKDWIDGNEYTVAKAAFIKAIEELAMKGK